MYGINTSNVTKMGSMFRDCSKLKTINLTGIDTRNVTKVSYMFSGCTSLVELDLASFNTANINDIIDMFSNCSNLKTIYVSQTRNINDSLSPVQIFYGNTSLVGGNGTVFDSTKTNQSMAVIDTPSTPGYLTLKTS